ncbi:MAG: hypothetical protein EOO24_02990 [Comamonadaceae bacterium]|nr:MAG: hypothetical protein EOO24_02990 [Comamonadaceae bacterium]
MLIAPTKTRVPSFRGGLIERTELEMRLDAALMLRRLVLLVAPAGFGKTAALSRQLERLPPRCAWAWVTVDEQDDLPRLIGCLLEALEPHDPPWRSAPQSLVDRIGSQGVPEAVVAELSDVLGTLPVERGVLVFDDVHAASDQRIFEFLRLLLERAPQNWTLVIASRTMPPLSVVRLRAGREVAEFGQADLSFSLVETQRLTRALGHDDGHAAAQCVFERTGGWPAGICLVLDASARSAEPAVAQRVSQRHLFDYLAAEVFGGMAEPLQVFLTRCSVLAELSAARCAKVSGCARAADMLDEIERRGLFVTVLDAEELTLRLHDLFRDFLEHRLRSEQPLEVPRLLRLAAEDEPDPVRKLDHLLGAGAWLDAEEMLLALAPVLLAEGAVTDLRGLLKRFPADRIDDLPRLRYARGLLALTEIDPQVLGLMHEAALGFEAEGDLRRARRALAHEAHAAVLLGVPVRTSGLAGAAEAMPSDLETDLALHARGYGAAISDGLPEAAEEHLRRLIGLLELSGSPALWFRFFPRVEMHYVTAGFPALVRRLIDGALAAAGQGFYPLQLNAHAAEASLCLWRGQVAESHALTLQLQADEGWARRPHVSRFCSWALWMAHVLIRNDTRALTGVLSNPAFFTRQLPRLELSVRGIVGCVLKDWDAVRRAVDGLRAFDMRGSYWRPFPRLLEARLALHEGRTEEGLRLLRQCRTNSRDLDRFGYDAMVRSSLAIAEMETGRPAAAWSAVEPLVSHVRGSGLVAGVLLCGQAMLDELVRQPWGPEVPREARAEMQRWAALSYRYRAPPNESAGGASAAPASSSLTARELEVLARIAAGDSNKLIARALDLSPHTVKRHVARILERLDLSSRAQAAAWFRTNAPG